MKGFEAVIGYQREKAELMQICDMIKNKEYYSRLGANLPRGVLIDGEPGLGKTLLATAFIKESGLEHFIVRRTCKDGEFVKELELTFESAKNLGKPCIVLLDDMDKFTTTEKSREEYVAVQTCIDNVKDCEVFVIATINDDREIPDSLLRAGRFDKRINLVTPRGDDSCKIINYYMDQKNFLSDMNREDASKMMEGHSCAELETIIIEAAIYAGYERKEKIELDHLIRAYLRQAHSFDAIEDETDPEELERVAYHEAGHLVMLDLILEDSVGMATVSSKRGGFVKRCKSLKRRPHETLVALAGKASVELKYGWIASGAQSDIRKASHLISGGYSESATGGFALCDEFSNRESPESTYRREVASAARMEEYLFKAKEILASNMEYVEKVAKALIEKRVLLNSDVKKIRESVVIKRVDIA